MDARLDALEARVARLEASVRIEGRQQLFGAIPPAPHAAAPGVIRPPAPPSAVPQPRPPDPEREAVLAGTWLARIGIAAVLLGAAFAFKYAVDRGLIGPTGRVVLGVVVGMIFVGLGERARGRSWPRLAQAVSGGGVGLVYLSVWAAFGLYGLVPPVAAFAMLALVVAGGAALSLHHRSEALALVALLGAFLNPYLTGIERLPGPLFGYVLLVDLGVAFLALGRGWRVLEAKALAATWVVAMAATQGVTPGLVVAFSATAFLLFAVFAVAGSERRDDARALDAVLLTASALAFFGVSMAVLPDSRGEVTLLLAGAHLGVGLLLRRFDRPPVLWITFLSLGIGLGIVAVPLLLDGLAVPIVWSIGAVGVVAAGSARDLGPARWVGVGILSLALVDAAVFRMQVGLAYDPARPLASIESLTLVVQIAALFAVARLSGPSELAGVARVGGHLLTVGWLSAEARALVLDATAEDPQRLVQFTLTAIWSLYAGALLTVGIARRRLALRLLAIGVFGATILKMGLLDLWLLDPLHRTIAFTGLGVLLLVGSMLYHRFRDVILENR